MKNQYHRILKAFFSFFKECPKALLFYPLTPYGRLETFIHTTLFMVLLYLTLGFVFILSLGTYFFSDINGIEMILLFMLAVFLLSIGCRIAMNRLLDLQQHYNDEVTLFLAPKRFLSITAILSTIILICLSFLQVAILDFQSIFLEGDFIAILFCIIFGLSAAALAFHIIISMQACIFPSQTLNIFEGISFSGKWKEIALFSFFGILILLCFYFSTYKSYQLPYPISFTIGLLVFFSVIWVKNTYIRIYLLSLGLPLLFPSPDLKTLYLGLLFIVAMLACRTNFLLTLLLLFGILEKYSNHIMGISACLYFALLFNSFDFKKTNHLLYAILLSLAFSLFCLYIAPLFQFTLYDNLLSIPTPLLLIGLTLFFFGVIYLNTKIKDNPKLKLLTIFGICAIMCICSFLPLQVTFAFHSFSLIIYMLILWIISHQQNISSAYKLAICSTLLVLVSLSVIQISTIHLNATAREVYQLLYILHILFPLFLSYFLFKIKSPFRFFVLTIPLVKILVIIVSFLSPLFIYKLNLDLRNSTLFLLSLKGILNSILLLIGCYTFYKLRNSFNPDLTLAYKS